MSTLRQKVVFLLIFILCLLLFTYPTIFHLKDKFLGLPGDSYIYLWNMWWSNFSINTLHINPYNCNYMYYPEGFPLILHTFIPIKSIPSIIFQNKFGLITTYNLFFLLTIIVKFWLFYFVAKKFCNHNIGAFLGAIIYSFAQVNLLNIYGYLDLSSTEFIQIFLLGIYYLDNKKFLKATLSIASSLIFYLYSQYYYLYYLTLALIIVTIFYLRKSYFSKLIKSLIAILILFLLIGSPIIYYAFKLIIKGEFNVKIGVAVSSVDLLSFIIPPHFNTFFKEFTSIIIAKLINPLHYYYVNPGFVVYFFSFAGLLYFKKKRLKKIYSILLIFFFIFSLGNEIRIFNKMIIPQYFMPYFWLHKLPILNGFREPSRAIIICFTIMSLFASVGISYFLKSGKKKWKILIPILFILFTFENIIIPIPMTEPVKFAELLETIRTEDGTVLTYPFTPEDIMSQLFQIYHEKPTINGRISRLPKHFVDKMNTSIYFKYFLKKNNFFVYSDYNLTYRVLYKNKDEKSIFTLIIPTGYTYYFYLPDYIFNSLKEDYYFKINLLFLRQIFWLF